MPTPSDLFLSPELTEEQARAYLKSLGFRDAAAVDEHLQQMADDLVVRESLGRLAPELIAALLESPDPDGAVAAMARYVSARSGRAMFLDYLREDPRALHVMTYVMGASPQLGEILVRTPEYFHWLVSQVERSAPDREDHEEELVPAFAAIDDPVEALNLLRRWKRRETLRIGTRDLLRHETVQTAAAQLSDVAAVAVDFALAIVMQQRLDADGHARPPGKFAVIATGLLGGREMSYEPDVELLYVYDAEAAGSAEAAIAREFFERVGRDLTAALRDETHEGFLYRVSLPAWPQTNGWLKACLVTEYADHYAASDEIAERFALARARAIAGDAELGAQFIEACHPFVYGKPAEHDAGFGTTSSRDSQTDEAVFAVEFLTQTFQLRHGARHAALRHTGTLGALEAIGKAGLIAEHLCRELDHAYVFLRSTAHRRQLGLHEDLQKQVDASRERVNSLCRTIRALADW
jgi:[glutamine synthetase] adenylyltransferase / [glutamine synthetase]-adenylyl-L-tyrosine phosphorylase